MDSNPNVEVQSIEEEGVVTDRLGLYAKGKLERGDTLGIPVMQVLMEKYLCLLSLHERAHVREATHSFKDLAVEAFRTAADQGLYRLTPEDSAKLADMKIYVTGVYAPRLGDNAAVRASGIAASYAEEPNNNQPNAIFSLALAQPVVLVDVEKGMPIHISYGCVDYPRTWPTEPDKCKQYEVEMGSENLERACRVAAKNADVRAAIVECLVHAVARTSRFHARSFLLVDMPFQEAKGYNRDVWEELWKHLAPHSEAMKRRKGGGTRYLVSEEESSTPVQLKVDVANGMERTVPENRILMSLPEGSTATLLNVHPIMRSVLARAVDKCTENAHVTDAEEVHVVRSVMVSEVCVPAFAKWKGRTDLAQRVQMYLATYIPPFVRMNDQTRKSVAVMQKALLCTGKKETYLAEGIETNEQVVVGLGVAMLGGLTVDTALAAQSFMNSRSEWSSYVPDGYVYYAEEFLEHETNEGLLAACKLKCEELNDRPGRSGLNQKVPTPTMFGLHACNSLVVEGYLSMLYLTGTLGTASTLGTARAGYIITKLVALWLAPEDNGELTSNRQRWKNWLSWKLQTLEVGIREDRVKYDWLTFTLVKNTQDIMEAHFFPGRGPQVNQDVKLVNAKLLVRLWDLVKKGEHDGGYTLNSMCQQFKMASIRAGERDGQLLKAVIAIENAAEMVYDKSQLHVSLDLVLKGINPTKANVEAHTKEVELVLDLVGNPNARKAGEVLMGGTDTLALADNAEYLRGARSTTVPMGQDVPTPLKMLDVKKGHSKVWIAKHNDLLAETMLQVIGKDMSGADLYTKGTMRAALVRLGANAAARWNRPTLVDALKDEYQTNGADDGTTTWKQAYSTQPWVSLWSQEAGHGAPIEDGTEDAKKKLTKGSTVVAVSCTKAHTLNLHVHMNR